MGTAEPQLQSMIGFSTTAARLPHLCKLGLDDEIPHHSTFSANRLGRFRESEVLRHIFERVVSTAMAMGLVKGEGFAADASVLEANASRYHGKAPNELNCNFSCNISSVVANSCTPVGVSTCGRQTDLPRRLCASSIVEAPAIISSSVV